MTDIDHPKIQDGELRTFAESGAADARETVIVELELTPSVRPPEARESWVEAGDYRSAIADIEGPDDQGEAMDSLERAFSELDLSAQPVRLESAQAFVVDVTPNQLRTIADWDLVGPIRLNRRHYAPRHASVPSPNGAPQARKLPGA